MKTFILAIALLTLTACASAPMTPEQHTAWAVRSCRASLVGAKSIALNTPKPMTGDEFAVRECLRSRGVHQ